MRIYSFLVGVALLTLLSGCDNTQGVSKGKKEGASTGMDKSRQELTDTLSAGKSSEGMDPMLPGRLAGRWLRSDGDYTIEIFALY